MSLLRRSDGDYALKGGEVSASGRLILPLEYLTYFGGGMPEGPYSGVPEEGVCGMEVDAADNIYVYGATQCRDFPVKNAYSPSHNGGGTDGFLAKFLCDGRTLSFSTYFGGTSDDVLSLVKLKMTYRHVMRIHDGAVYLAGATSSGDYPVTANAVQRTRNTLYIAGFLSCFTDEGHLRSSTYLGGPAETGILSMTMDPVGHIYVYGTICNDTLWFISRNAVQSRLLNRCAQRYTMVALFAAKISEQMDSVLWCTYYYAPEGRNMCWSDIGTPPHFWVAGGLSIHVDSSQQATLVGVSGDTAIFNKLIPVKNAKLPYSNTDNDIYITKLNTDATDYVFSSRFGGSHSNLLIDTDMDADGNLVLHGFLWT
jgi:hypothetical protein